MFVDLTGFVKFADSADPEVLFGTLQRYHAAMGEIIDAHSGRAIDFIGDGIFAIFNDPVEIAEPEYHALRAAVEMRDRFRSLAEGWAREGIRLGIKISLDAGYATLGRIGYPGHHTYGAVGRTINSAGLMIRAVEEDKIMASERLMSAVEDRFETRLVPDAVLEKLGTVLERRSKRAVAVVEVVGLRRK